MSNTIDFVITGNEEGWHSELGIFPHPTAKHLNIPMQLAKTPQEVTINVYSPLGRPMATYTVQAGFGLSIDVSEFAAGLYFSKARRDRDVWTNKFLKKFGATSTITHNCATA